MERETERKKENERKRDRNIRKEIEVRQESVSPNYNEFRNEILKAPFCQCQGMGRGGLLSQS